MRDRRGRSSDPASSAEVIGRVLTEVVPDTPLAAVQTAWPGVVGERLAAVTTVVGESEGVVTVECRSAVWAEELAMMETRIRGMLNDALGRGSGSLVEAIRFRSGDA